jgi:Tol biopolymer transport system component
MLDLYRAQNDGDEFQPAEALSEWNTEASESDPEFSADGKTLLFWSSRQTEQGWTVPQRLESAINSAGFDFTPSFSPDGRWIYFASTRRQTSGNQTVQNGQSNLYRVSKSAVLP